VSILAGPSSTETDPLVALIENTTVALILARFDTQDKRFDSQDKQLETVLREVRRTNGRVTTLETGAAVARGVADVDRERTTVARRHVDVWIPAVCVLVGGLSSDAGHHLGWW